MTKDEIRAAAMRERRALLHDDIIKKSRAISTRLMPFLENADTVMCYIAAFNEPRTADIIQRLYDTGKRIVVPVSDTSTCTIHPSYLSSPDRLIKGGYGIPEPMEFIPADVDDIDISIIPGIAFDRSGMRIGFGKGYYDRFLADFRGTKIGLCYEFQLYSSIPCDSHDIPMDIIITEGNIYNDF